MTRVAYAIVLILCGAGLHALAIQKPAPGGYVIEHDAEVAKNEPGTHNGGGQTVDGKTVNVTPGTAVLTRTGSSHSLRQTGSEDLVILINYEAAPHRCPSSWRRPLVGDVSSSDLPSIRLRDC